MDRLQAGIDELGVVVDENFIAQTIVYLELLTKWSKIYNLTAILALDDMITKHVLDSLAILPYLAGTRFIDVGTGAGLPGLILAIANPQQDWTLLDSAGKKTRFLTQVKQSLFLENVTIINARVEAYQPEGLFDGVVTRAFSALENCHELCKHLLKPNGAHYAMKASLDNFSQDDVQIKTHELTIPFLDQARQVVIIHEKNINHPLLGD